MMGSGNHHSHYQTQSFVGIICWYLMRPVGWWLLALQCMSTPGFGRVQARDNVTGQMMLYGVMCPVGTYNIGEQQHHLALSASACASESVTAALGGGGWGV